MVSSNALWVMASHIGPATRGQIDTTEKILPAALLTDGNKPCPLVFQSRVVS